MASRASCDLNPFDAAQQFKPLRKIVQILAFGGIDDANAFQRNIERSARFFDLRAITQKNRRAQSQRIELAGRLQARAVPCLPEKQSAWDAAEVFR